MGRAHAITKYIKQNHKKNYLASHPFEFLYVFIVLKWKIKKINTKIVTCMKMIRIPQFSDYKNDSLKCCLFGYIYYSVSKINE